MPIPLSTRTVQIATLLFDEPTRSRIEARLLEEASENLPFFQDASPERMERIRYSIMKLIIESPKNEDHAFAQAKTDWRDLFVAAGFGDSATEHDRWYEDKLKHIC